MGSNVGAILINTSTKFMRKGEMTRAAILDVALELASRDGLEGLTIGLLADKMNMSKSGVFAHFGSREDLQLEVLKLYHRRFEQEVFYPSIKEATRPAAPARHVCALGETRHGRNRVRLHLYQRRRRVRRPSGPDPRGAGGDGGRVAAAPCCAAAQQSIDCGHLKAGTDAEQLVYEMYGLILAVHHDARFLRIPGTVERAGVGFNRLIENYQS
jgi:AcrR family transcriptional regulator